MIIDTKGEKVKLTKEILKTKSWYRLLQVIFGAGLVLFVSFGVIGGFVSIPEQYLDKFQLGADIRSINPTELTDYTDYQIAERTLEIHSLERIEQRLQEVKYNYRLPYKTQGSWGEVAFAWFIFPLLVIGIFMLVRYVVLYILIGKQ